MPALGAPPDFIPFDPRGTVLSREVKDFSFCFSPSAGSELKIVFLLHVFSGVHVAPAPPVVRLRVTYISKHPTTLCSYAVTPANPQLGSNAGAVCEANAAFIDTRDSEGLQGVLLKVKQAGHASTPPPVKYQK